MQYVLVNIIFNSLFYFQCTCRENDFEDGNHYYRFIEHEPFIPKCYNFRGSTNDSEPKPAVVVGQRLHKIMSAILESHASDDKCLVDYAGISKSEEFRRYAVLVSHWFYFYSIYYCASNLTRPAGKVFITLLLTRSYLAAITFPVSAKRAPIVIHKYLIKLNHLVQFME